MTDTVPWNRPFVPMGQSAYTKPELVWHGNGWAGEGNATLPIDRMQMFDEITLISQTGGEKNRGQVRAELNVRPDLWFFSCHFRGDPVMPGCLGLDALWQMLGFYLSWLGLPGRGRALSVGEVKFRGQVLPPSGPERVTVEYGIDITRVLPKLRLGFADGWLKVNGIPIYTAVKLNVGLFSAEALAALNKQTIDTDGSMPTE